jgi:HEAT repeat protein
LLKHYADGLGGRLDEYTVADLIFSLQDNSMPWKVRRRLALELGKRGTDEAVKALTDLVANAESPLKALIAEALGQSPHPRAEEALLAMLRDKDEAVAQGAVRGLTAAGHTAALATVLRDSNAPAPVRATAALGLGGTRNPAAVPALLQAYGAVANAELQAEMLSSLGRQGGDAAMGFLQHVADRASTPIDLRVAAVGALGNGSAESVALLLRYAGDVDSRVRAEAAWGLAMTEPSRNTSAELAAWLARETDAAVRLRIYQALANQTETDAGRILPAVLGEKNAETRLAGLTWWATVTKSDNSSGVARSFDTQAVPELWRVALSDVERSDRLNSVIALRRAATPGALGALQDIAAQANDVQVVQAAQAALRVRK